MRPAASSAPSTSLSSSTPSSKRVEGKLDQRYRGKAARRDKEHHAITPLVLGSLALSIPLIAVAGAQAGPFGVAIGLHRDRARQPVRWLDASSVELTDYRERFPILAETTYLISHSLGPMPAEAAHRLAELRARRGTRAASGPGAKGWWELPVTVGDQIARLIGAPPGSTVMHQNVTVAEAVVLSCFDLRGERRPDRVRGGELPVGPLPAAGAAGTRRRGRRLRGRGDDRRGDRRADAARPDQPRHLQDRARSRTSSRSSSARTRSARTSCSTAYQSVGHRAARRDRARRRLRGRRQRQVALRRPGRGLALRPPRPGRDARADARRLAGAHEAVRASSPSSSTRTARGAS